jgi:two-component system phosphate regulon sensor histidine kinase PhoR
LRLEEISLGDLAEWVQERFTDRSGKKSVTLIVSATDSTDLLCSDRGLVELILSNLVDNALKFTPADGRVECCFTAAGDEIVLRVTDTGCGIAPEDQPRVFERFYQSDIARSGDTRIRGTGLGLAIVKHAAERLKARLELSSELGKGTTVQVIFSRTG